MQFKNDKRSLKTRKAIKFAFLKLLRTRNISEINITMIAKNADINRNSFYTHYKNVSNILDDINNDINMDMEEILVKYSYSQITVDPYPIISEFSKVVVSNKFITQYLVFSKSSTELARNLKDNICDRFYAAYLKETTNANPYIRYVMAFIISSIFEMYYTWIRNGNDLSLDDLSKKMSKLILDGLSSITW